jgi:oxalate decarboxylase/phosphoglucose isomerase-like protein (cupin superfamily)
VRRSFPINKNIARGLVTIKPGGVREPQRLQTVVLELRPETLCPRRRRPLHRNTGDTDLVFLEMSVDELFQDSSMNIWLRRLPPGDGPSHLDIGEETIRKIPTAKQEVIGG